MFSYSTGYYVSPPDDQYLKFKNRCSLVGRHLCSVGSTSLFTKIIHRVSNLQDPPSTSPPPPKPPGTIQYGHRSLFIRRDFWIVFNAVCFLWEGSYYSWYTYNKMVLPRSCDKGIFLLLRLEVKRNCTVYRPGQGQYHTMSACTLNHYYLDVHWEFRDSSCCMIYIDEQRFIEFGCFLKASNTLNSMLPSLRQQDILKQQGQIHKCWFCLGWQKMFYNVFSDTLSLWLGSEPR
jgi:hypothetical protein